MCGQANEAIEYLVWLAKSTDGWYDFGLLLEQACLDKVKVLTVSEAIQFRKDVNFLGVWLSPMVEPTVFSFHRHTRCIVIPSMWQLDTVSSYVHSLSTWLNGHFYICGISSYVHSLSTWLNGHFYICGIVGQELSSRSSWPSRLRSKGN
jgi:hypothetical protein